MTRLCFQRSNRFSVMCWWIVVSFFLSFADFLEIIRVFCCPAALLLILLFSFSQQLPDFPLVFVKGCFFLSLARFPFGHPFHDGFSAKNLSRVSNRYGSEKTNDRNGIIHRYPQGKIPENILGAIIVENCQFISDCTPNLLWQLLNSHIVADSLTIRHFN